MLSLSDIVNVKVGIGRGVFEAPGATVIGGKKPSFNLEILKLFANGEQGFWYDPNDLSTMFQEANGIIPVTEVGQPVGLILDKSKYLRLAENLMSFPKSESLPASSFLGDAVATWSLNTISPVSGTIDSRLVVSTPSTISFRPSLAFNLKSSLAVGKLYKMSFKYKVNSGSPKILAVYNGGATASIPSSKGILVGEGVFETYIRWQVGDQSRPYIYFSNEAVFDLQMNDFSCTEVLGNHAYQTTSASRPILRQNATTGANYLEFDGTDDFLQTNNIDFTATDKITTFSGFRKLSDTTTGIVCESDSFYVAAPTGGGSATIGSSFKVSTLRANSVGGYPAPVSITATTKGDVSANTSSIRINGMNSGTNTGSQGVGNYSNSVMYIGRRAGTVAAFNGHIYNLIGIGRIATDSETTSLEKSIAKQVGVTL